MNAYESLNQFFEKIKNLGFWQRLFGWRPIQRLSYDALEDYKLLMTHVASLEEQVKTLLAKKDLLNKDNSHLSEGASQLRNELTEVKTNLKSVETALAAKNSALATREETIKQSEKRIIEQQAEIQSLKEKSHSLQIEVNEINKEVAGYKKTDTQRSQDYENKVSMLTKAQERVQNEREEEKRKAQEEEVQRIRALKETWAKHEVRVKEVIKSICQRQTIEYVEKVPFKGSPDNTIKICDEFVIFDAKSPSSDDLENFPAYIRQQTEAVKKYAKLDGVKKDIFLVIPSNTVDVIEQFAYNMADYNVYIVTIDVLEPLILCLKRIEDYEFIDQLTPEERENICRIIGKFVHITKRKIQIDHFFTNEFMSVLSSCEGGLPSEILNKVNEFEKSEKLNPPQEKRAKRIALNDLKEDAEKLKKSASHLLPSDEDTLDRDNSESKRAQ